MKLDLKQNINVKEMISMVLARKDFIVIGVIIILTLHFSSKVYKSEILKIDVIKENIRAKEVEIEYLRNIQLQEKKNGKFAGGFEDISLSKLVRKVTQFADSYDLRVIGVDQQKTEQENLFDVMSFRISLEGFYHNLGQFIRDIENSPEFIWFENIKINPLNRYENAKDNSLKISLKVFCAILKEKR
ncbi:MAG: type 4a pilus biogenesis protein PilO [Candidatus Gygaella obscura]|nr:type 4a pilus biogenesis protein PilO [Candidatus Gygaella obscura]